LSRWGRTVDVLIDDAKLPPPTPANPATTSSVLKEMPGFSITAARIVGTSSSKALHDAVAAA